MIKKFLEFGEESLKTIIIYLFSIGSFLIAYKAFVFGKAIYLVNYYNRQTSYLQDGQRWYSSEQANNLPLGIAGGIMYFIVLLLIWKLICELLFIIFERIERK